MGFRSVFTEMTVLFHSESCPEMVSETTDLIKVSVGFLVPEMPILGYIQFSHAALIVSCKTLYKTQCL